MDHFQLDLGPGGWLLFVVAGIFTGIINTLAGSGSLITLPIFIFFCGLPPTVANGTNRIGVLIQSIVGSWSFYRQGKLPIQNLWPLLLSSAIGAYVGSRIAADLDETLMNYTIGGLMVFMLAVLLVSPKRWLRESIRHRQQELEGCWDVVFIASPRAADAGFDAVDRDVAEALRRIGTGRPR